MNTTLATLHTRNSRGFTIVELLIVIVVIGILAAIVTVSVRDLQTHARNTQKISAAVGYEKIIRSYMSTNGTYPGTVNRCLGENNPDSNSDGIGDCGVNGNMQQNAGLNTNLKTISNVLPTFDPTPVIRNTDSASLTGILYNYDISGTRIIDGKSALLIVVFYLQGNAVNCGSRNTLQNIDSSTAGETWTTGANYTYTTANSTSCYIGIPAL